MKLTFTAGALAGREAEIAADEFTIGRDEGNDLRIPTDDRLASRRHARFIRRDGHWLVHDLNSANGVWLDGRRIVGESKLRDGQSVRIGAQHATVGDVAAPGPVSPPQPTKTSIREQATVAGARPRTPRQPARERTGATGRPTGASGERARGYSGILARADRRIRRVTTVAVAAVLLALGVSGAAVAGVFDGADGRNGHNPIDVPSLVEHARASTVMVTEHLSRELAAQSPDDDRLASGSGWVLDARAGLVVTNGHVAASGQRSTVNLAHGRQRDAAVVAVNQCQDVALLRTRDNAGLRPLPQVSQDRLRQGDPVVALGFPGSLSPDDNLAATTGVISVVRTRALDPRDYPNVVQTDAAINHGNSGGPLLDARGRLVGMNTLGGGGAGQENENFAIATDHIHGLLGDLRSGVSHGWLGWVFNPADTDEAGQPLPAVTSADGEKFYGPQIVGPADGTTAAGQMVGLAGGRRQYVYAVDGVRYGPGDNQLDATDAVTGMCPVNRSKKTGDTSTLSVLDVDEQTQTFTTFDVQVTYR